MADQIGQTLMTPMMGATPQDVSPPELETRKSMWRNFRDRLKSDPNLRMSLLATGASLMKTPGYGQSGWDVAGNAIAQGLGTYAQGRMADRQSQQQERKLTMEEKATDANIANDTTRTQTGAKVGDAQVKSLEAGAEATTMRSQIDKAIAEMQQELEPRKVAADEKRADAAMLNAQADRTRADAYRSASGGTTSGNVILVERRKQALLAANPGMSPEDAELRAQNDILLTSKSGGNPAQIATSLFKSELEAWTSNFDNIGKTPTPELLEQMKTRAKEMAKDFAKLNGPTPAQPGEGRTGMIDRTPQPAVPSAPTVDPAIGGEMPAAAASQTPLPSEEYLGKKVELSSGGFGEIVAVSGDGKILTLKLPNGQQARVPLEQAGPYIVAE